MTHNSVFMSKVDVDSHGRVYIPKKFRDEFGTSFRIVPYRGELKLIPVSEDAVEDLRTRTKTIRESEKSAKELKEEAREELERMAGE